MAVSIVIDITQNSQNIANNTSNVTVKVNAKWTGGSYNLLEKSGSCTIDGTKYTFTSPFNTGQTTSGSCNLYTKTLNITHGSDGKKTLAVSASYTSGVSSGTVAASASKALTTIPRKSTLSVADGVLGKSQTLTVTRQSSSFTHTVSWTCGTDSDEIVTKSSSTSFSWMPGLGLSKHNINSTAVIIKFTITTYNGNTNIGSVSYNKTFSIPASVKPSCSISVTDAMGYKDTYGGFVQNKSKCAVTVTPTLAYSSPIKFYEVTANGAKYTKASFTTGLLSSPGDFSVSGTVTDGRSRTSDTCTVDNLTVLPYSPPKISQVSLKRVDIEDLAPNPNGEYVQIQFSASVSPLNNINTVSFRIDIKESGESWEESTLYEWTPTSNIYEVTNEKYLIPANPAKSYEFRLTVSDDFSDIIKIFTMSTKTVFISQGKNGTGISFGKAVELGKDESLGGVGVADFAFDAKFNSPVYGKVTGLDKLPYIPSGSNLDDYLTTGCWAIYSNSSENLPSRADQIYCGDKLLGTDDTVPPARAGRFEVISATGEGIRAEQYSYLRQKFYPYNSSNAVWERDITRGANDIWTYYDWWQSSLTPIASERVYNSLIDRAAITIALSANVTLGKVNTYTKIPFNTVSLSTSNRLSLSSNAVRIGKHIQYVKVSGQTLIKTGIAGQRHARIQKVSGSTTTSLSWDCIYAVANSNTLYPFTPVIVPVTEGDLIQMVFYTGDATDQNVSGSAANGWQSYLTVEEL